MFLIVNDGTQHNFVCINIDTSPHTVFQTFRLLEYFLQHEMGIAAFFYLSQIHIQSSYLRRHFMVHIVNDLQLLSKAHHGNIVVIKIYHLVCIFYNRSCIGTKEKLIVTNSNNKRTLLTGCYYLIFFSFVKQGNGIRPDKLMKSKPYSSQQVYVFLCLYIFYKLYNNFRIRVGTEMHSIRNEFLFQIGIILYYTVVYYRKIL